VVPEAGDLGGVGVGDAHEFPDLEAALHAAGGGQHPVDEAETGVVLGALTGALGRHGVGEPGGRQHGEEDHERHQPADERGGVAGPDGPVDHGPDHDRHEGLADLMGDKESGAGDEVAALAEDGLAHHGARRGVPHTPSPFAERTPVARLAPTR
jgi:hypothetical protein